MHRTPRLITLFVTLVAVTALSSTAAFAQRRHPPVRRGAVVFVGGYFYDPFFGPYPWWPRAAYPYAYFPVYDSRAVLRIQAEPNDAAVYVDGFYAGIVDDFDNIFQGLPLPPGGHEIVLYLERYRTVHRQVYLAPGSTFKLQETLQRLSPGEASEPPNVAPPLPPPPPGSFAPPRSVPPAATRPQGTPRDAVAGTLTLHVQPPTAEIWIDGERWASSSADGRLSIELGTGLHHLEVVSAGYLPYSGQIEIRQNEVTSWNVALMRQ